MSEITSAFDTVEDVVLRRRSNLRMDLDRPVSPELVERVCRLAIWAPNHKHTHPWRFTVLTGDARSRLGEICATSATESGVDDATALTKLRTKYLRAPVMVIVSAAAHADPVLHAENRDAVAAGVENMLLGATALGLASYWSTGAAATDPVVKEFAGISQQDQIVAIIYLGWPASEPDAPKRPDPEIRYRN